MSKRQEPPRVAPPQCRGGVFPFLFNRELTVSTSANPNSLAYVGKIPGARDSDSWFTPSRYIEKVRKVLGVIELDPFSSREANGIVKAERFFDHNDSALNNEWDAKKVFMNPPYSGKGIKAAVARFLEMGAKYRFEAIVLVNNATETKWFQSLLTRADAVCFTDHRIAFYNKDGKTCAGNTRGQAFLYFGRKPSAFTKQFKSEGEVLCNK
jgi:ParB family chromosome partitioning protein